VPHRCAMGKRTPALRAGVALPLRGSAGGTLRVPHTRPAAQGG
ncbi:hypothetical protein QFZ64_007009, partial [Streptomyces sp. B3I8]|nr:hypothetical protein [Streptomyces sp. B3I8]